MARQRWLLFALLAALPAASATTYGAGSQLEAATPVTLEGRADTWLPGGTASFIGSGATQLVGVDLRADEATLVFTTLAAECDGPNLPRVGCAGNSGRKDETFEITDLQVSVVRALGAYKVLATTDRAHADTPSFGDDGRLIVTTATTARLDTNDKPVHVSPLSDGWTQDTSGAVPPVYDAEAWSSELTTVGALIRATGGFESYFQGVAVRVRGVDADGDKFDRTFETRAPQDGGATFLVVEATDAELVASSSAPLVAYAPADQRPVTDVHSRAGFTDATGTVIRDSGTTEHDKDAVSLTGPLSLTLTKIDASTARATYTIAQGLALAGVVPDEEQPPLPAGALAAAGAAGAGGAGALFALAYFWPRLKYAGMLALLPLYTRIERDAVLEHEKRDELYELIRVTPGIHAHEIGEKARIGWGTTVYHLKLLENHGLIVSKKSGRYKRFFVNTGEYTKKKDVYGALRNETAKAVADYIVQHPGTTQKEMCAALGIQPSLASWHVEKLEGVELVKRVKDGRMVRYFAGPAWSDLNVPAASTAGPASPVET